jgi:flagellar biogenesis protein FliO
MVSIFDTNQFLIIGVFLIALIGLMLVLRRFRDPLAAQLGGQRRIALVEDTSIGGGERIKLVTIDQLPYAIVTTKNQQPVVVPLDAPQTRSSKPQSQPSAASKPAPAKASAANAGDGGETLPFLQAMKQARLRNPKLGFDQ